MGYSPWDRKESDRTEGLHFHFLAVVTLSIRVISVFFCSLESESVSHSVMSDSLQPHGL